MITPKVQRRERFSSVVTLTPETVSAFSTAAGDDNPLHHDAAFAASMRYGRIIASGTHTSALLLALTASHFSKRGAVIGLEFTVRFRRPIYAGETIVLEWLVVKSRRTSSSAARSWTWSGVSRRRMGKRRLQQTVACWLRITCDSPFF